MQKWRTRRKKVEERKEKINEHKKRKKESVMEEECIKEDWKQSICEGKNLIIMSKKEINGWNIEEKARKGVIKE